MKKYKNFTIFAAILIVGLIGSLMVFAQNPPKLQSAEKFKIIRNNSLELLNMYVNDLYPIYVSVPAIEKTGYDTFTGHTFEYCVTVGYIDKTK